MVTTDESKDFVAIGVLAGQLRTTVRTVERIAGQLGMSPALRLNGVPHFDGKQVEKLAAELRGDQ